MRRKWKQSVNFDSMASDAELDEAYLDELEQQVRIGQQNLNQDKKIVTVLRAQSDVFPGSNLEHIDFFLSPDARKI